MEKVLVINDSPFERLIMKDMVSRLGYEAKSSDEYNIMNLVESYDPNIIIANMTMSKTSGDKLIAAIKIKKPGIKCYLSSCSKIQPDRLQYLDVDGFIKTPISPGHLNRVLQNEDQEAGQAVNEQQNGPSLQPTNAPALAPENQEEIIKQTEKKQVNTGEGAGSQPIKASFAFCPYCGQKIADSNVKYVFCPFCGNKF